MTNRRKIPVTNCIELFMHCSKCIKEIKETHGNLSPKEYASLEVGWTQMGFQVWCKRHETNVIHVDFDGKKFHANYLISDNGENND